MDRQRPLTGNGGPLRRCPQILSNQSETPGFSFAQMGGVGQGAQRQAPWWGECGGVFIWGLPADAGMGAVDVVVRAPVGQRGAGMGQRREQGLVQQFVRCPAGDACISDRGAAAC